MQTVVVAAAVCCIALCSLQVVDDDGLGYCDDGEEYLDRHSGDEHEDVSDSASACLHNMLYPSSNTHITLASTA
jgi:hypothetical protein